MARIQIHKGRVRGDNPVTYDQELMFAEMIGGQIIEVERNLRQAITDVLALRAVGGVPSHRHLMVIRLHARERSELRRIIARHAGQYALG